MSPSRLWMGIDVGTQSVRALLTDDRGTVVATGAAPLASQRDGVRHEQDPESWWSALATASRKAFATLAGPSEIGGVAICGTSGTVLLQDGDGRALTLGLMYDDARAGAEAEIANLEGTHLWERLGYGRIQRVWALPKAMWLLRNGGTYGSVAQQADHLAGRLAGHPVAADLSNALKTGCDTINETWDDVVMSRLGIAGDRLPPLCRPGTVVGRVGTRAAEETGIPIGTPIVAGMTDGCAAQLGAGAFERGCWNSVLGTTLVLKGTSEKLIRDPGAVVYSHRAPDGTWLPGGASSSGAGALSRLLPGADLEALGQSASVMPDARAVALPLTGDGERFPFVAPDAQLFFIDGEPSDPLDLFIGVTRGVAAIERLCFDYLALLGFNTGGRLTITGGASRSRYWNSLRATMLGRPLSIPRVPEPAMGMAILAAASSKPLLEAMNAMVTFDEAVEPVPTEMVAALSDYIRLIDSLVSRGWLSPQLARHAVEGASQ